jgi:hypothetical protein
MNVHHTVYGCRVRYITTLSGRSYSRRVVTVVVNGKYLRFSFTLAVIHRKASYMAAVSGKRKRLSFSAVSDRARSFTAGRD